MLDPRYAIRPSPSRNNDFEFVCFESDDCLLVRISNLITARYQDQMLLDNLQESQGKQKRLVQNYVLEHKIHKQCIRSLTEQVG